MLVYQLPSLIVVFALPTFLRNKKEILGTMIIFFILYLLNVAITYGQFIGNKTALLISSFIGLDMTDVVRENQLGSFLGGLTGNVVNNGYFLSSCIPLYRSRNSSCAYNGKEA